MNHNPELNAFPLEAYSNNASTEAPQDLVVLGEDPTRVDPLSLIDVPIERTMVGGRWVFEA